MQFSILFFLLYVAVAIIIGIVTSRKETEDDFMIAGRQVQGVQVAATMSAGFFDGATLSIFVAYIYLYGFSAIWVFVGFSLGFLLLRRYAHAIRRKAVELDVYSMPEYFFRILGKRNGLMFSFFLVLQFFLLLVVNLIISGKVLASIFPIPYFLAVIIGGAIILTYLVLAGFKAVVRTDFFQMIIMIVMSVSVALFLFGKADIPSLDFNFGSLGLGNIVGFLILAGFGIMVAPDLWQRIFATKDEKNLERGLTYSSVILLTLGVVISTVGLVTRQFFPDLLPEDALVIGFSHLLPFGLREFGMVLLYAVALSSSDTVTFVVSSIFTRDFKNYSQKYSKESMKRLTRFFMIFFVVLASLIAILYQNILALGFSLASLNLALFPVVFGSLYWKLERRAVFWSLALGFLSIVVLFVTDKLNPQNAVISLPVVFFFLIIFQKAFRTKSVGTV